jgi:hypothetical protein
MLSISCCRQQYISLFCMLKDLVGEAADIATKKESIDAVERVKHGVVHPATCTAVAGVVLCHVYAEYLSWRFSCDVDQALGWVLDNNFARKRDVVILQYGAHHAPGGGFYKNSTKTGALDTKYVLVTKLLAAKIRNITSTETSPTIVAMEIPPFHFKSTGGWRAHADKPSKPNYFCYPQLPTWEAMVKAGYTVYSQAVHARFMNDFAMPRLREAGALVIGTDVGKSYWEAHFSVTSSSKPVPDCLHLCIPGVPDLWNLRMLQTLMPNGHHDSGTARAGETNNETLSRDKGKLFARNVTEHAKQWYYSFAPKCKEMSTTKRALGLGLGLKT